MKEKFMDYVIEMDAWNQVATARNVDKRKVIEEKLAVM